jgi:uncharacterized membrane-anchored protein
MYAAYLAYALLALLYFIFDMLKNPRRKGATWFPVEVTFLWILAFIHQLLFPQTVHDFLVLCFILSAGTLLLCVFFIVTGTHGARKTGVKEINNQIGKVIFFTVVMDIILMSTVRAV